MTRNFSVVRRYVAVWLFASCLLAVSSARGDIVFSFTAQVVDIQNPVNAGVWGGVDLAAASGLTGTLSYDGTAAPDLSSPTDAQWDIPIPAGGLAGMSLAGAGYSAIATSVLQINASSDSGPAFPRGGYEFQFMQPSSSTSFLGTLPDGQTVGDSGFLLSFLSTNPALGSTSLLPSNLNPLSQWNLDDNYLAQFGISGAYGTAFADILDVNGDYAGTAMMTFSVTSLTAVPEPSLAGIFASLVAGFTLVRNRRHTRSTAAPRLPK